MKDILLKLIDKVFDFKVLIVLLVVLGYLKYEWAAVFLGVATKAVLKFIGSI